MLEKLRRQIGEIDRQLLELMAARQRLAAQVGEVKAERRLAVKNPEVEAEVLAAAQGRARALGLDALGLDEGLAVDVMGKLIEASCRLQQSQRRGRESRRIFVIGAAGGMGQWASRCLTFLGHEVRGHDLAMLPADIAGTDFECGVRDSDFIVFATPISVTAELLKRAIGLKPPGVLFDLCSVKAPLLAVVAEARHAGLRVASAHPMLGPTAPFAPAPAVPFLLCETGVGSATDEVAALFEPSGLIGVRIPLDDHDRLMAWALGLPHLLNLIFAGALRRDGPAYETVRSVGGSSFSAQAELAVRVTRACPDLYFEIQAENAGTLSILDAVQGSLDAYGEAIRSKDRGRFRELMERGRL
jgi:chorismate mutase / prephenate dehydrogenase